MSQHYHKWTIFLKRLQEPQRPLNQIKAWRETCQVACSKAYLSATATAISSKHVNLP